MIFQSECSFLLQFY